MATLIFMFSLTAGIFQRQPEADACISGEGLLPPLFTAFRVGGYGISTSETDSTVYTGNANVPAGISLRFASE